MASEILDIELRLKIERMVAELEKIPGVATKEARKMAMAWSRDYAKVEKDAQRMAREAVREAERVRDGWKDSSERMASLVGGRLGDISDSVLDLGARFGELSGMIGGVGGAMVAVGGAFTAGAFAVGFAGAALVEFMADAQDTLEALEAFAGLDGLTEQQRREIRDYGEAMADLEAVSLQLKAEIQAGLAPTMTELAHAVIAVVSAYDRLVQATGGVEGALNRVRVLAGIGTLGLSELAIYGLGAVADEGERVAEVITKIDEEFEDYGPALDDMGAKTERLAKVTRQARDATQELADQVELANAEAVDMATRSLDAMVAYERQLEEQQQAAQAAAEAERVMFDEAAAGWERVSQEAMDYARMLDEDVRASQEESLRTLVSLAGELAETIAIDHVEAIVDAERAADRVAEKEKDRLKTERERIEAQIERGKLSAEEGKLELQRIDDELEAVKKDDRERRRLARQARKEGHQAWQAAAIARATIDAAANAVALTAAFVPIAGPFAPAAAALAAGASLALQVREIKRVKAPSFAGGGMVRDRASGDHVLISADPNEGILTPRGVANAGGPQGVAALNRGTGTAGNGPTLVHLDSRLMGEVMARVIESDQRVTSALQRRAGAIPGIRR